MLSARAIYNEIRADDRTYQLFLSIAADGETQGGWENERIAALTRDPELAGKILRHGEDEYKHGRLFTALLRKRDLEPTTVPDGLNYTEMLEAKGIGLSHERLRKDEPLSDDEIIKYLVHSRVTEQRAAEEVAEQGRIFGDDPELGRAVRMIADDEENHLAYTHEELLRFCEEGHGERIHSLLAEYAKVEIGTYRDVSLGVMGRMGECLGWSRVKVAVLAVGIRAIYWAERLWGWRRMAALRPPERKNAMAPRRSVHRPAPAD
jgi:rubrerythrin